jgi:hypothetical protein
MKANELPDAPRHAPVLCSRAAAEQHGTSFTSANQPALCQLNKMRVLRTQAGAAQLTVFDRAFGLSRKAPQTFEWVADASIVI